MKTKNIKIIIAVVVLLGLVAGSLLATRVTNALDPSGVHVTLFGTDLMADKNGSLVSVLSNTAGIPMDLIATPDGAFGSNSAVPIGTYKRIHFTVQNQITWDGTDPCDNVTQLTNKTLLIDGTQGPTAQVALYFATADDGGSSGWMANGTADHPFLLQTPIVVQGGQNTVVKLMFLTAGTAQCINSTAELLPPDMGTVTYVETPPVAAAGCNFNTNQTYWFVHYNINNWVKDYLASMGTPTATPTEDQVLSNTSINVGWGSVTFEALDSSGTGTWYVDPRYMASNYANPGMAEHRHRLRGWDPTNPDEGLHDPTDASAPGTMGGRYTVAGQKVIMYFPEGGHAEGAVSMDCNTFVGTNISTPSENDLILATKKPSASMSSQGFPAGKYQIVSNALDVTYDLTTTIPWSSPTGTAYPAKWMSFQPNMMYFDTAYIASAGTGTGGMFSWKPNYPLGRSWGASPSWTSNGPEERVEWNTDFTTQLASSTTRTDGLWSNPTDTNNDAFIAFNEHGNGVFGGSITELDSRWTDTTKAQHYLQAGFIVKTAASPSLADVVGKWVIGVIESHLESGMDSTWGTGDEQAKFGLTYGEVTIDSSYHVNTNFVHKDAFAGLMSAETGTTATISLHDECYAFDTVTRTGTVITATGGACVIPGTSDPGMVNKVFYVVDNGQTQAKIVLNADKNTILIFRPVDTDNIPYNVQSGVMCTQGVNCGDASRDFVVGMGVKVSN